MPASAEIFSGVIRGGPEHQRHGEPYDWFTCFRSDPDHYGVAVVGPVTPAPTSVTPAEMRKEVFATLKAMGYSRVRWWRARAGGPVMREYAL